MRMRYVENRKKVSEARVTSLQDMIDKIAHSGRWDWDDMSNSFIYGKGQAEVVPYGADFYDYPPISENGQAEVQTVYVRFNTVKRGWGGIRIPADAFKSADVMLNSLNIQLRNGLELEFMDNDYQG